MKRFILLLLLSAAGCAQYGEIKEGPQKVKGFTVTPSQEWNRVPSSVSPGGAPTWTADGVSLNSLSFFSEIQDGRPIMSVGKDDEFPVFRADMLPTELAEMMETSIAKGYQATIASQGQLRPIKIDNVTGFEYSFEFVTPDELPRRAYVAAVIKAERLHAIFYQAARMYYYDRHIQTVTQMVRSATLN